MTALSETAWYVYAVVQVNVALPNWGEAILPGANLVVLRAAGAPSDGEAVNALGALASLVPRALFGTDKADAASRAADPDWVAARAAAHHAVVARLSEQCVCLPLGFGTLFSSAERVRQWLTDDAARLRQAMDHLAGRVEWSLTLVEDAAAHGDWVDCHDADMLALSASAASTGHGTAFLLQRRLGRARDAARLAHCHAAGHKIEASLAAMGLRVQAESGGTSAAWSILADKGDGLAEKLRPIADAFVGTGLTLRVTGPWPPYAFARAAWQERQDA